METGGPSKEEFANWQAPKKDQETSISREAQILATDPRDYIGETVFQKAARSIDQDPNHPWEREPVRRSYLKDSLGQIISAEVREGLSRKLLIVQEKTDGEVISALLESDETRLDLVEQAIKLSYLLPAPDRHALVGELMSQPALVERSANDLAEFIATAILEKLPDSKESSPITALPELPQSGYGQLEPNEDQQVQLERFFALASRKLSGTKFNEMISDLKEQIPYTDGAYDKNYRQMFFVGTVHGILEQKDGNREIESGVFSERLDAQKFPVKDLIKNPTASQEELAQRLADMTIEKAPDLHGEKDEPKAEFVSLDKIVGGPNMNDWTVSTSSGRGPENIYKLAEAFQKGADTNGVEPIKLFEYEGKYFVDTDGRHRVAALKALGVPFAPMLVSRYKS